jgi:hypothetical protein
MERVCDRHVNWQFANVFLCSAVFTIIPLFMYVSNRDNMRRFDCEISLNHVMMHFPNHPRRETIWQWSRDVMAGLLSPCIHRYLHTYVWKKTGSKGEGGRQRKKSMVQAMTSLYLQRTRTKKRDQHSTIAHERNYRVFVDDYKAWDATLNIRAQEVKGTILHISLGH